MAKYDFSEDKFVINPYTFVKSKKEIERLQEGEQGKKFGVISCKLWIKTPLLIPDEQKAPKATDDNSISGGGQSETLCNGTKKENDYVPFMSRGDEQKDYIIPGSSLRGPIRSVYEALTNSCFVTARPSQNISTRTKTAFKPGLLIWVGGKLVLRPAKTYLFQVEDYKGSKENAKVKGVWCIPTQDELRKKYKYGEELYFRGRSSLNEKFFVTGIASESDHGIDPNVKVGYLFMGEYISKKRHERIFCVNGSVIIKKYNLSLAYQKLKETIKSYQSGKINKNLTKAKDGFLHHGYDTVDFTRFEKDKGAVLPVWYRESGKGQIYLSFASIGRYNYEKGMDQLLGERLPCTSRNNLCPACRIFGMTGKNEETGLGSRIRFSDGVAHGKIDTQIYGLSPLRTPHPSYLPFYAITGDYGQGYDAHGSDIRGRKFYWHHSPAKESTQNPDVKMRGVASGSFSFFVYYEGLTQGQLAQLLWLLCLGENKEGGNFCFKIGHGKPLGYGSVKITVEGYRERTVEAGTYTLHPYNKEEVDKQVENLKLFEQASDLKRILNFTALSDKEVSYPYVVDQAGCRSSNPNDVNMSSAQWFSKNMELGSQQATVYYTLSYPTGKNPEKENPPVGKKTSCSPPQEENGLPVVVKKE